LEAIAGMKLIIRGRNIRLTPAGESLGRLARRVLGDITRTHTELEWLSTGSTTNILRIGSITAGLAYLLPIAICAFQKRHKDVSVHIIERKVTSLLESLESRDLDLIVGTVDTRIQSEGL